MAAGGEYILPDVLVSNKDRFFTIELLWYNEQLGLFLLFFWFTRTDKWYVSAPAGLSVLALVFSVQFVNILIAQQDCLL